MYQGTFDAVSNREDWTATVEIINRETDAAPALDDIVVAVGNCHRPDLELSLAAGTLAYDTGNGWFTWTVDKATMARLRPGTYPMGITLKAETADVQLFAGTIQVVDGVVR